MRCCQWALLGALSLCWPPSIVKAEGTLDEAVRAIAEDIQKFLKERDENSISTGQFRGFGDLAKHSSVSPNLVRALTQRLADLKIEVRDKSNFTLQGDYGEIEDENTAKQGVFLKVEILKRKSTVAAVVLEKRFVKNEAALAVLLGLTVQIPPEATPKQRNEKFKEAIDNPRPYLNGTRINSDANPQFGVEILVAPPDPAKDGKRTVADFKVRAPESKDQLAFVPIKRDEVYGVRLFNDAPFEAAVDLRIDGLSMFTFSDKAFRDAKTGQPLYKYVVIPPGRSVVVRGWFVTADDSDELLVTSYARSAAGMLGSPANVGTVTANFHAAWDKKTGVPPADEPKNAGEFAQAADATGRGKRFEQKYEVVEYKTGVLRSTISVRYSK